MPTALLLISFQGEYYSKKAKKNLNGAGKSAKSANKLLEFFRKNNLPVAHVLHTGKTEKLSAEKIIPHELLTPMHEELSVLTNEYNAFANKKLDQIFRELEVNHLLVAGLTAENQVLFTVNAAKELGYSCEVVTDACAASSLKTKDDKIKAEQVHQLVMAMMANNGVALTTAKEYIKAQEKEAKKMRKAAEKQEAIEKAAREAIEAASKEEPAPASEKKARGQNKNTLAKKESIRKTITNTPKAIKTKRAKQKVTPELADEQLN